MSNIFSPYFRVWCGVAVIYLLFISAVAAQPFGIKKYTINDGLPDAYILHIYQDSNGFLWIGTANGLSRFDGKEFVNYNVADGLPDEYVNAVIEDRYHRLWVGTRRGIAQMKGGKLTRYPTSDSLTIGFVFGIREMASGQIWGLTDKGIYEFNNDHWEKIHLYNGLENIHCRNLVETGEGMIVNYGDYLVSRKNNTAEILEKHTGDWPYYNVISQLDNKCYVSTRKGLFQIDDGRFYPLFRNFLEGKTILHYFNDSHRRTWISLINDGLFVSRPNDTSRIEQHIALGSNLISQVFEDRAGIIWIATSEGLVRAEPRNYLVLDSIEGRPARYLRNLVRSANGQMLVSAEKEGLVTLTQGKLNRYTPKGSAAVIQSFANSIVDGYCMDRDNTLWMVTRRGKLFTLRNDFLEEKKFGSLGSFGGMNDITYNGKLDCFFISSDTLYEGNRLGFRTFLAQNTRSHILFPLKLESFSNGITLVGTRNGEAWMIDSARNAWPYSSTLNIPSNTSQVNFYKENERRFWVSFSGGLKRYHWNGKDIPVEDMEISEENGLSNNSVYSVAFDGKGRLWAVTASGIVTIEFARDEKNFYIRKWNDADGITPENLHGANTGMDDFGNMWVQLVDRLYIFSSGNIHLQRESPEVVITNVQLSLQQTNWKLYTDSLLGYMQIPFRPVLPAGLNSLGIFYKGISFRDYSGLEYSYRLNGDSSSWSAGQKNGFISFVGLPPGKYQFMVKVKDSNNGWSRPAEFSFEILKPFWQRWWFILLLLFLTGYLVFALFQFRLHEKLVVLNVRQKLHRDLHDDIGATLSSIKVYTEVLQDDPGNSIIIGLIRENAEDMISQLELIAWATNPQNDSFKSLCELMKKYAIPACYAKKIDFDFRTDSIQSQLIIPGNVRKNLFLVFKEAINNILKYSEATACKAEMVIRNHKFILEISDNGKGMKKEERDHGYGMQNMHKRAEELKGTLDLITAPGMGVTIRMVIPFPFKIPYTWDERGKEYQ